MDWKEASRPWIRRAGRRARREPLVGFALLAALFWLVLDWTDRPEDSVIRFTSSEVDSVIADRERTIGRPLVLHERGTLFDDLVEEEVLFREALRLGMDEADSRVRQRLISKMRYMVEPEPPEPTEEQLREFLDQNRDRYRTPERLSFEHVYYRDPPRLPERTLVDLRMGTPLHQPGERFWLGADLWMVSEAEISAILGPEFARTVSELPDHKWNGPMLSARGTHFVRVTQRRAPTVPAPEAIWDPLRKDWREAWIDDARRTLMTELREGYRISQAEEDLDS